MIHTSSVRAQWKRSHAQGGVTRASLLTKSSRKPRTYSAYRVRFKGQTDDPEVWVVMAYDATEAMRSALELNPYQELLSCRLLEAW